MTTIYLETRIWDVTLFLLFRTSFGLLFGMVSPDHCCWRMCALRFSVFVGRGAVLPVAKPILHNRHQGVVR